MPFHIVIAGDFAGANPERPSRPIAVDRDNLEDVLGRVRPVVELPLADGSGKPLTVPISTLEDFHPDRLYTSVPLFQAIRDTVTAEPEPPPARPAETPPKPGAGGFLDDILASTEERYVSPAAQARDEWDEALHRIATSHAQPKVSAARQQRAADAEKASTAVMRAILHSPRFQSLEAAWRGLDFVTRRLDTSSEFSVMLLDVSKSGLAARMSRAVDDEWGVVLANYTFGPVDGDLSVLRNIADAAAKVRVPVIAAASPMLLGCEDIADLSDPSEWRELPTEVRNAWTALRRSPVAAWVGLALPRLLMRLPYGAEGSSCEEFPFEEMGGGDPLSWTSPVFACAALLGESWMQFGEPDGQRELDGMLSYSWREDGVPQFQPAGEVLLTDRAVEAMLDRGLIPLMSSRHGSEIRVPRFQSLADPALPLEFRAG